uniref:EF-hand domain-containing protein n=1 Tax=Neobodo designis TaxID=312471 RepID=A0A7S1MA38_NEODS|mmetsp:Transcript_36757/g.113372  ORF Transcript_36757/g.113372 Transcript_36757/m.113372 type:complete len:184 (+) Transcript_36757:35-586(+)
MSRLDPQEVRDIMAQERVASKAKRRSAPSAANRVTEEQIRSVFNMFDATSVGSVPMNEVELMLKSLGIPADAADVAKTLESQGVSPESDSLTLAEFTKLVEGSAIDFNSTAEAERVFGLIDTSSSGAISFEVLRAALDEADARVPDEEIREVLRYCALSDKSGESLSRADWLEVMNFVNEVGI